MDNKIKQNGLQPAGLAAKDFAPVINHLRKAVSERTGQTALTDGISKPDTKRLEAHGIYKRFWNVTMESISKRGVPDGCQTQWDDIRRYVSNIKHHIQQGEGLMLVGPVGTMKTTMAIAVLREYIESCDAGFFIPMVSLLDNLNQARERQDNSLETRIRQTPLLVLDDLGAEYDHTWVQAKVDAIITERYNRMRATIITSNLDARDILDRYQQRIFDRLRATNLYVKFEGKSLRDTMRR